MRSRVVTDLAMRAWLLALLAVGCKPKSAPAPPSIADANVASISSDASTTDAGPSDLGALARGVAESWNDAHVTHDARALERLYAPSVVFYGTTLSGLECSKRKAAAFKKSPDFKQAIRDVVVDKGDGGTPLTAQFWKTTTEKGVARDFKAVLVLDQHLAIKGETDDLSEYNLARMRHENDWCTDADLQPTEKVIPPFKISLRQALNAVWVTKHMAGLRASYTGQNLGVDIPGSCPTATCNVKAQECGWSFRVVNLSNLGITTSIMVEWVWIDAVRLVAEENNDPPGWSEPVATK
jgi:hypothetical protein